MATYDDPDTDYVHPPVGLQIQVPNVVAKPHYIADAVDTRYTPLENIQTYIEGTPVYLNYYQQVVTKQTELRPPQISSDYEATVQQEYRFVEKLEVRQSSSFSVDYDSSTGSFNIQGDLTFYPRVAPNKHDILIGDIGLGKGGIFIIDEVTPLMYTVQRSHSVQIKFLAEINNTALLEYLEKHTIESYRYNTDYLRLGRDPMMTTSSFDVMTRLKKARREVLSRFLGKFYDRHLRAPVLFHASRKVYDPLLTAALKDVCERSEHPDLAHLFSRPTDEGKELAIPTVWNCLVECNEDLFYTISQKMWVLPRTVFGRYSTMHGIRYSNIDYIVYPADTQSNYGQGLELYERSKTPLQIAINHFIFDDLDNPSNAGIPTNPDLIPVEEKLDSPLAAMPYPNITSDDYYVFSGAFYNDQKHHQSMIEREVGKMLRHEKLDQEGVVNLCNELKSRPSIEQFYYSVVLMALTRYAITHSY